MLFNIFRNNISMLPLLTEVLAMIDFCIDNDVMIRITPNMKITAEKKHYNIVRHSENRKTLLANNRLDCVLAYAKRFRIEKLFQNLKSSGFDIEKSKIKKYDKFKKLLFLSCFAQSILVLIGKLLPA